MTNQELLDLFGSAKDIYILDAQKLRSGESGQKVRKLSTRKLWLLIAAILALLALSATAYAAIQARIRMTLTRNNLETTASQYGDVIRTYYPQNIAEGYALTNGSISGKNRHLVYENAEKQSITFSISTKDFTQDIQLRPPVTEKTVEIAGQSTMLKGTQDGTQVLAWSNPQVGYFASLFTTDPQADLAAMAESVDAGVALEDNFQLQDGGSWNPWYPQKLPEGYSCVDVTPISEGSQIVRYASETDSFEFAISISRDLSDIGTAPHSTMEWEDVDIAGVPGRMVTIGGEQRILFWKQESEGSNAMLMTTNSQIDLISIAASVGPGEPLKVSDWYIAEPDYDLDISQDQESYVGYEPWYPQEIPEGYRLIQVTDHTYGNQSYFYENDHGGDITYKFTFQLGDWGSRSGMGTVEEVEINGNMGYYFPETNTITWVQEEKGFAFSIWATEDVDVIAMARSVALGPDLTPSQDEKLSLALEQLGDYRITQLPEGMVQEEIAGSPLEDGGGWYSYVRRWYVDKTTNDKIYMAYESYITAPEDCASAQEVADMQVGSVNYPDDVKHLEINGCPASALEYDGSATVAWAAGDGQKGTVFSLYSQDFTAAELVEIAKSVRAF
ncbi:MAG TPA: hypothetical protein IAB83_02100 [Candidatus Faecousia faecavium]|nr:hypothetical protein [Candidatus Faecousia faecavium]